MSEQYIVYSDGGCQGNPGPAGWGAVVIQPSGKYRAYYGFLGKGTNQIAEVAAAINGLKQTPPGCDVELVSDSQYMLKGLKEWRSGWERRGWKTAAGEPVKNKELFQKLYQLVDDRNVTTRWVKGHNGDKFNEIADALASKGLQALNVGEVLEYHKQGSVTKADVKVGYKVGDKVMLTSTEEKGVVVSCWVNELGGEEAYIAFFGNEFPTGKPEDKPYVLHYATGALTRV